MSAIERVLCSDGVTVQPTAHKAIRQSQLLSTSWAKERAREGLKTKTRSKERKSTNGQKKPIEVVVTREDV